MVYYFDDAKDGVRDTFDTSYLKTGKFNDILRHFYTIPSDLDSIFEGDDEVVIFYHDSMSDVNMVKRWIKGQPSVSYIQFSDGVDFGQEYTPADEEYADSWTLKKKLFYEHLGGFLWAYKNGVRSLEHFLEYEMPAVNETSAATEMPTTTEMAAASENSIYVLDRENPNIRKPQKTEVFVRTEISGKSIVIFDLDALSPEFVGYMATYIRLSIHTAGSGALASFVFAGEDSFVHYLSKYRESQSHEVLLWVGSTFVEKKGKSLDEVIANAELGITLTPQRYINDFLKNLKVSPNAEVGNHSIANYWGAYVIARHIAEFEWQAQEIYMKALKKDALYLKYLIADRIRKVEDINNILNGSAASVKFVDPLKLKWNPKVLLIDDQDDIWTDVIEALMPEADLTVIGKSKSLINSDKESMFLTKKAQSIINYNDDFDLILLDLRLGGVLEEEIVNGDDCSGMKILKEITDRNPGQQVIMFTSSNKAWNLKNALIMAAGYYIKESPLQPFNEEETFQNLNDFLSTIKSCLNYRDLKNVVKGIQDAENLEFNNKYRGAENRSVEVRSQLGIVKTMALSKSREVGESSKDWTFVYIALFQILEIVKRLSPNFDPTDPGNKEKDPKRNLVNLIVSILPNWGKEVYEVVSDEDGKKKITYKDCLFEHNGIRGKLVHKGTDKHATYNEFVYLWKIVDYILRSLAPDE